MQLASVVSQPRLLICWEETNPPHPPPLVKQERTRTTTRARRRELPKANLPDFRLFQWRKRLSDGGLMMKTAPKRDRRHEDRQDGDQTHTHTSPL